VLGVGSFTYQYNTRDTLGFAAKGAWFEVEEWSNPCEHGCKENVLLGDSTDICKDGCVQSKHSKKAYNIYKDPITDDGTKKSLKGLLQVNYDDNMEIECYTEQTPEQESQGLLQVIYEDGKFYNQTTLEEVRKMLK
jgi:nicotinamide phosphoribosyltransferase